MQRFLSQREPDLIEWMDKPDCDVEILRKTYAHFRTINKLLSGWRRIYKTQIRPHCTNKSQSYSLLDIGFGGGDIPLQIAKWSKADGINLNILAIELDDRALEYVRTLAVPENVQFKKLHTSELINDQRHFDFVISNHVLHHLQDSEVIELISQADSLARRTVIFSDIERNPFGYALFKTITPLIYRGSFITKDGLLSIRRSFTFEELRSIIPKKWKLDQMPLFRLLLTLDKS